MTAEMKTRNVSAERLISAVREFPSIWDSKCPDYKKKFYKKRAWSTIANELIEGFNDFDPCEQNTAMVMLIRRWNNIRDYYNKELKAERIDSLRGVTRDKKTYMYADALRFIKPELERNMRLNISEAELKMEYEEDQPQEEEGDFNDIVFVDSLDNYDGTPGGSETSMESVSTKYAPDDDHDMMFLKSLLPDMKKLEDEEKFEFKYAILTAYKDIMDKRKTTQSQDSE